YAPLRGEEGRVVRWYATATDIDDRKRAEERAHQETLELREELDKLSMFEEIVGASRPLQAVLADVSRVAPTDSTVLIPGGPGTGEGGGRRCNPKARERVVGRLRQRQLRRHPAHVDRLGAVRPREGRVHGSSDPPSRPVRARRGRDDLPRRDRRPASRHAA